MLERCAQVDFMRAPVGRCTAGATWLYFYPRIGLCGFAMWGRPTAGDVDGLGQVLRVELDQPPHVSLVDARRVESVEPAAFEALGRYVATHHTTLSRVVTRLALVRPAGMMGAVTAGFFSVQAPPYEVEVFDETERALDWLDVSGDFRDVLDGAIGDVTGAPALLNQMRAWIAQHLAEPRIADAAHALGTSERSLQRKLREHATTFQSEVNATRIRAAQRMLLESDAQLTSIALDVGCSSLSTFSALFRKLTHETPTEWRKRTRGA